MNSNQLLSKTITVLRFPLIVAVVFVHFYCDTVTYHGVEIFNAHLATTPNGEILLSLLDLFACQLPAIAVPSFYIISGYLLFFKSDVYTFELYTRKVRSRFFTLFIPYVSWIVLLIIFNAIKEKILFNPNPTSLMVRNFAAFDYLRAFFAIQGDDKPYLIPMWYVRDLMALVLLSPVIYFVLKKFGKIFLVLAFVFFILQVAFGSDYENALGWFDYKNNPIGRFFNVSVFFFSIGAYFGINKKNPINFVKKWWLLTAVIYIALLILVQYELSLSGWYFKELPEDGVFPFALHNLSICFGIMTVFGLTASLIEKGKVRKIEFLSASVFFIYASHTFIEWNIGRTIFLIFKPQNGLTVFGVYLVTIVVTILVCMLAFIIMRRVMPKFTAILCGGRD